MFRPHQLIVILVCLCIGVYACDPKPTATPADSESGIPSRTAIPTATKEPTFTPSPTVTATPPLHPLADYELIRTVDTGAKAAINNISFSEDGQQLAIAYNQYACSTIAGLTMHVLDLNTNTLLAIGLNEGQTNSALALSPDGNFLAAAFLPNAPGGGFYLGAGFDFFDIAGLTSSHFDTNEPIAIKELEFSPGNDILLSTDWSENGQKITLRKISDLSATPIILTSEHENNHLIEVVHFSRDGEFIVASRNSDNDILIWRVSDGGLVHYFNQRDSSDRDNYVAVDISPDGKFLAATDRNRINIWDLETEQITRTFELKAGTQYSYLKYSGDGKYLLTHSYINGYPDTFVNQIWDIGEGRLAKTIGPKIDGGYVANVAISPNGRYIAVTELGCSSRIHIFGGESASEAVSPTISSFPTRMPAKAATFVWLNAGPRGSCSPSSVPAGLVVFTWSDGFWINKDEMLSEVGSGTPIIRVDGKLNPDVGPAIITPQEATYQDRNGWTTNAQMQPIPFEPGTYRIMALWKGPEQMNRHTCTLEVTNP